MAGNKDIPRIKNPPSGDGHHVTYRYMTATELAERDARQKAYEAMLGRQDAFERSRQVIAEKQRPAQAGCVFAKSCNLPDAIIDYSNPSGVVPTDSLKNYGEIAWLGARDVDDAGLLNLETISGSTVSLGIGRLALRAPALAVPLLALEAATAATLAGVVALFWTPSLGDSALYTEDQLRALKQARTRVRLQVEQQADGSLKGYGFYTGKNRDWEMVDVVQFTLRGSQQVADLGEGVELIWTPAVDGSDILGIPALEAAPQAPHIWVYPPTPAAASIIVNPVYPPEYKDFILVFPADSGIRPVYIVLSQSGDHSYYDHPKTLPAFPDTARVKSKSSVQGGGRKRARWVDSKGRIYEWDYKSNAVEKYDKLGVHLGEFNHITGEQTKPAKPGRKTSRN
ncbi:S-type pyocin domain-containing protein [Pseudomonas sp. URMO17WK12:I11]|uniref:S-type pyocin domain-containing protein n=1 Tax=Pseudomonas sp. URMO17WK12:I11 TaxID=1283291 RepID=UPI000722863D|nr:S-type pyocin domain-containing protein [Pseudomonas sp. URMO17WK12:I11]CRL51061.1 S-type Pyocin [Pseudomonas sp. URMO17WK12:I11]